MHLLLRENRGKFRLQNIKHLPCQFLNEVGWGCEISHKPCANKGLVFCHDVKDVSMARLGMGQRLRSGFVMV